MIKANDLRLGNWVKNDCDDKLFRVDAVDILTCYNDNDWLLPIPLTPELLVKAGFTKHLSSDKVLYHFFKGENPVTHDWLIDLNWIIGREYPFYKNGYHEIKYLHQLQNLFYSLTGEELEVNLSETVKP
jgi:hypothetical protein